MKKTLLVFLLVLALCLPCFVGCDQSSSNRQGTEKPKQEQTDTEPEEKSEESSVEKTEESSEEKTEERSEGNTEESSKEKTEEKTEDNTADTDMETDTETDTETYTETDTETDTETYTETDTEMGTETEAHVCSFGNWVTVKEASCAENGNQERACACGKKETQIIDATGHDEVTHEAQAPTCTEIGWDAYATCSRCNYSTYIEVPKLGHVYVDRVCTNCSEHEPSEGLKFTSNGDGTCYVSGIGDCKDTNVVIPAISPKGDSVTSIGKRAFMLCDSLSSVVIGNSVTRVDHEAFYACENLTSVTIGDSVTSIGYEVFYGCGNLTNVTIGDSVASIGYDAFYGCTNLTNVYITDIAQWCNINFYLDDYANPLYIANNLYLNGELVVELAIPEGVTSIDDYLFYDCDSIRSVRIPDSVTSIGDEAFFGCDSIMSVVIPDSVKSIGSSAFSQCIRLTSVTIGNSVTSIGDYAFYACRNLTSVIIGKSVTRIGDDAFNTCCKLIEIFNLSRLSINVNSISNGDVSLYAKNVYTNTSGTSKLCKKEGYIFYCDADTGKYYLMGYTGSETDLVLPYDINGNDYEIYEDAFCFSSLTSVVIPGSVTSIGSSAFMYCQNLTDVTIPDSVASIGENAFGNCSAITSIEIPDSVTSISSDTFFYCSSLTSIEIPDSVTSIGWDAFNGCSSLTSIEIPDSVTSIGDRAFKNCSSLESITIPFVGAEKDSTSDTHFGYIFGASSYSYNANYVPKSLKTVIINGETSIDSFAFNGCSSLTSVTIGDGVTKICNHAFDGCYKLMEVYNLSSLTITAGTNSNGFVAYHAKSVYTDTGVESKLSKKGDYIVYCDASTGEYYLIDYVGNETNLVLPENINGNNYEIYQYAFYDRSSLTSVVIPDSVTSIGDSAFYNCSSLTSVTIPDSVTSIANDAFCYCSSLASVTIGDSVTSIGDWAFARCSSLTIVNYTESEAQWAEISIGLFNSTLTDATIVYNYVPEEE